MKLILTILAFTTALAHAHTLAHAAAPQPKTPASPAEKLVLTYINSILTETYNEGEGHAKATKAQCKQATAGSAQMTCNVIVKVQPDTASSYKTGVECWGMEFEVSPDFKSLDLNSDWEECADQINGVTEN